MRTSRRRYLPVAVVILGIIGAIAWRLAGAAPSWYAPPNANDPRVAQLADDFEYRLVEELHRERDDPFTIRLREEQINAWLAARLPKWVAGRGYEWPEGLGTIQLRLTNDEIHWAAEIKTATGRRYVGAVLNPRLEDDSLILTLRGLHVGRLSLRGDAALSHMSRLAQATGNDAFDAAFADLLADGIAFEPGQRLADGRRFRLLLVAIGRHQVDLTLETTADDEVPQYR